MSKMPENENHSQLANDNVEKIESFEDPRLDLSENLLRGIYSYGFEKPSPIQQQAIYPLILDNNRDVIGQAQSGTGKTGTFVISILKLINFDDIYPQAVIIVPTRELAIQIQNVIIGIGEYCKVKVCCCIGGQNVQADIELLQKGVHVVVGTPGRIYHMIKDTYFKLNRIKLLIIDEVDQMLDRGFKDQLYEIFQLGFPLNVKIGLFSATLKEDTLSITKKFMKNPVIIEVKKEEVNLEGIKQYYINVGKDEHKFSTLIDLYKCISLNLVIIYCNNKQKLMKLADELISIKKEIDISFGVIHGDMDQDERNKIMNQFKSGNYRILLSTDLLARGIDIQQLSLVINYDIPINRENYMHRIGRTGRYGRKGVALNFITDRDGFAVKDIEEFYHIHIQELPDQIEQIFM
jgi:translation initiation factor 4A